MEPIVTRFAPSPTGRLHLGHAFSAIRAHDLARANGGRFLLRIEDIDGTRSRPEHVETILEDLRWLGLGWDGEVVFQSRRLDLYAAALDRLRAIGLVYPCFCTRAEIAREVAASASAPHGPDGPIYPGTCRSLSPTQRAARIDEPHAWRLDMERALATLQSVTPDLGTRRSAALAGAHLFRGPPVNLAASSKSIVRHADENQHPFSLQRRVDTERRMDPDFRQDDDSFRWRSALVWTDEIAGPQLADPRAFGDVVLARKDAPASYHLAVTVDDAAQAITHVVRGEDLFAATHVHRLLQALLGLETPVYRHHPLLTDAAGNRLAKRSDAPTLVERRCAGEDGRAIADRLRKGAVPAS